MSADKTRLQYYEALEHCKNIYINKLKDYGASWRVFRPSSLTDQLFIKAQRLRSIEEKGVQKIKDDSKGEFVGLVNYSIIALIQLHEGTSNDTRIEEKQALSWFDREAETAYSLMSDKNHDYDEAWRDMRISSLTDMILVKILRIKQIENNQGKTLVSEGVEGNYLDIINYAIFALIKLAELEHSKSVTP